IVEVETLKFTNQSLIDTLDEVLKIQDEGRTKRAAAEVEIRKLEEELKQKLLEVRVK
ncbi:MAG: toxic anion resistance protein, partial [Erysipelotrichaceae bacterium]|nr:toxic anion resistance protein [Erysipelotrichaceae bacterium]